MLIFSSTGSFIGPNIKKALFFKKGHIEIRFWVSTLVCKLQVLLILFIKIKPISLLIYLFPFKLCKMLNENSIKWRK